MKAGISLIARQVYLVYLENLNQTFQMRKFAFGFCQEDEMEG